jgi:hypothetical protein
MEFTRFVTRAGFLRRRKTPNVPREQSRCFTAREARAARLKEKRANAAVSACARDAHSANRRAIQPNRFAGGVHNRHVSHQRRPGHRRGSPDGEVAYSIALPGNVVGLLRKRAGGSSRTIVALPEAFLTPKDWSPVDLSPSAVCSTRIPMCWCGRSRSGRGPRWRPLPPSRRRSHSRRTANGSPISPMRAAASKSMCSRFRRPERNIR